jgi:tRNA U34 2-thiouridine synthase MnmA/TrmU
MKGLFFVALAVMLLNCAPEQAAVFYDGDVVVGSGTIRAA